MHARTFLRNDVGKRSPLQVCGIVQFCGSTLLDVTLLALVEVTFRAAMLNGNEQALHLTLKQAAQCLPSFVQALPRTGCRTWGFPRDFVVHDDDTGASVPFILQPRREAFLVNKSFNITGFFYERVVWHSLTSYCATLYRDCHSLCLLRATRDDLFPTGQCVQMWSGIKSRIVFESDTFRLPIMA